MVEVGSVAAPCMPVGSVQPVPATSSGSDLTVASGPDIARQASTAPILNPDPVLDPGLGITVMEYFSRAGAMTSSYPDQRQLESYRLFGVDAMNRPSGGRPIGAG